MTRTDSLVVGTLVVLLALIAGLVGVPSMLPGATTVALATPSASSPVDRPYREGVLGRPVSVSPFTAHSQADRDLVALVFSGLVRNGPAGTIVPDLAERWTVDPTGAIWTFVLRDDARWQDGDPVTADDVAFTIHVLQDPAYTGPGAGSWNGVTVNTDGARTVVFTLATPLGGFLQAATQPIAPAHLLSGVPVAGLADLAFGHQPIGSGPFAVASIDADTAELIPAATILDRPDTSAAPGPTDDSLAPPTTTERPAGEPIPYLPGIEFHFYDDPDALAAAYRAGSLDAASGLSPELTRELALAPDSRALHYPGSTLTTVLLNLRAGHPEFTDPAVRGSVAGGDRPADPGPGRLLDGRRAGDQPDPAVVGPVRPSRRRARSIRPCRGGWRAQEGRLDARRRRLASAEGEGSRRHRTPQPGPGVQPGRLRDRGGGGPCVEGDRDRGPPRRARARDVRERSSRHRQVHRRRRPT